MKCLIENMAAMRSKATYLAPRQELEVLRQRNSGFEKELQTGFLPCRHCVDMVMYLPLWEIPAPLNCPPGWLICPSTETVKVLYGGSKQPSAENSIEAPAPIPHKKALAKGGPGFLNKAY